MADEHPLLVRLRLAATRRGARLFRNNTGLGWVGKFTAFHKPQMVRVNKGDVLVREARPLHAGIGKGGSDLIGWTPVTITPDMVGTTLAVFTAVEAKTEGVAVTPEQAAFVHAVLDQGGKAGIAFHEDDLDAIIA
jgi:hypothetical protein